MAVEPIAGEQRILPQAVLDLSRKVVATSEKASAAEHQTRDIRNRLATFDAAFRFIDRSLGDIRTVLNGFMAGRSGGAA